MRQICLVAGLLETQVCVECKSVQDVKMMVRLGKYILVELHDFP
jgi:hypothetical protein